MPTLSSVLESVSAEFAAKITAAIRAASLEEIHAETRGTPTLKRGPGRPPKSAPPKLPAGRVRRGAEDLQATADLITKYVKSHPGSNSETIRKELGIAKNHWAKPIAVALASEAIKKKGEKRASRYWAA